MKDHVKILLLGDEGVGKSSLISALVSRHFPQEVPHIMTDAIMPAEVVANNVPVTIMDSSAGHGDREVLKQKISVADCVIALHDLARPETISSLINFWLPLVNEIRGDVDKPVIVVGAKADLREEPLDEQQQIDILTSFPIVHHCLSCSAVDMQGIDMVFQLAQECACYPSLNVIWNIEEREFTPSAHRAFLRVFRILDLDGDHLLNDSEFSATQQRCFDDTVSTEEINLLKMKIESELASGVLNNCVTLEGFLHLIKLNMSQEGRPNYRLPWQILQRFHYDEELNIVIPEEVTKPTQLRSDQIPELSAPARAFLLSLAHIAYSECERPLRPEGSDDASEVEESLTWDALRTVLSVLDGDAEDPWADPPAFKTSWQYDENVEQRILLRGLSHIGATLSFEDWITHWSLLVTNDPVTAQVLLFKLGYAERSDLGVVPSAGPVLTIQRQLSAPTQPSYIRALFGAKGIEPPHPRTTVQACVLGDNGVGKSSFVWHLTGLRAPGLADDVEMGVEYSKFSEAIVVGGCTVHGAMTPLLHSAGGSATVRPSGSGGSGGERSGSRSALTEPYQLSIAAVPLDQADRWIEQCVPNCDLAVIMFQCGSPASLRTAIALENRLPPTIPRVFLASKSDTIPSTQVLSIGTHSPTAPRAEYGNPTRTSREALKSAHEVVLQDAAMHLRSRGLPPLVSLSTLQDSGVGDAYSLLLDTLTHPEKGLPKSPKRAAGFSLSTGVLAVTTVAAVGVGSVWLMWQFSPKAREWLDEWIESVRRWFTKRIGN